MTLSRPSDVDNRVLPLSTTSLLQGVRSLCNVPYMPQARICHKPVMRHVLRVTILICHGRECFVHMVRVRLLRGVFCDIYSMVHIGIVT